jgi:hypothetical protein
MVNIFATGQAEQFCIFCIQYKLPVKLSYTIVCQYCRVVVGKIGLGENGSFCDALSSSDNVEVIYKSQKPTALYQRGECKNKHSFCDNNL